MTNPCQHPEVVDRYCMECGDKLSLVSSQYTGVAPTPHKWVASGCACHVVCMNCDDVTERKNRAFRRSPCPGKVSA